ncbi:MAG: ATP-binding protein [Planctomycetaceae bacterium]
MKRWFSGLPIDRKVFVLCVIAAVTSLLVSTLALIAYGVESSRSEMALQLTTLSEITAANSRFALAFSDRAAAEETLRSLRLDSSAELAALYDLDGQLFVHCCFADPARCPMPESVTEAMPSQILDGHAMIVTPVNDIDGVIGHLYVRASTSHLDKQLRDKLLISLAVLIGTLVVSLLVSHRLQAEVSQPIIRLARVAHEVSQTGNYSYRVSPCGGDEVGTLCDAFNNMLIQIELRDRELTTARSVLESRVEERTQELTSANLQLKQEVDQHKKAQTRLIEVKAKLIKAAHAAGMAEIATGVLHNVGNVLNSVNVSMTLLATGVQKHGAAIGGLAKAQQLLDDNQTQLGPFFSDSPQGKHFRPYLETLRQRLAADTEKMEGEVRQTRGLIEHIKEIVASQQDYAKVSGVQSECRLSEMFEEACMINDSSLIRHGIEIVRDYAWDPLLNTDRQRILQVLVNLLSNAKHAVSHRDVTSRTLTLSIRENVEGNIVASVQDSGIGISPENLGQIFRHGFTTKANGHGFGLHYSALIMKQLGGTLSVESEGVGKGATFTCTLPRSLIATHVQDVSDLTYPVQSEDTSGADGHRP